MNLHGDRGRRRGILRSICPGVRALGIQVDQRGGQGRGVERRRLAPHPSLAPTPCIRSLELPTETERADGPAHAARSGSRDLGALASPAIRRTVS